MLQIKNIFKQYKTGNLIQKALDGVSLNLRDNEFVAILGPSGSGKTTLLNIIGGLDRYDQGDLIINGISTKKYRDRDWDSYRNHTIGFVFQSYNLIPHQTVLANVELALTISGISKAERREKARKALEEMCIRDSIYPALALADAAKERYGDIEILFVGNDDRMEASEVPSHGYAFQGLHASGLTGNVFNKGRALLLMMNFYRKACRIIDEFKPDIAIGFGGYVSAPVMLAAHHKHVATIIHEQNSIVGVSNKMVAKYMDCLLYTSYHPQPCGFLRIFL